MRCNMALEPEKWYRPQAEEMAEIAAAPTLANWRSMKIGPPYSKRGSIVLYHGRDVIKWLEDGKVTPAA